MNWQKIFKFDQLSPLLNSENTIIEYFTKRDLLDREVPPINHIWKFLEIF